MRSLLFSVSVLLVGCAETEGDESAQSAADVFMSNIAAHCGNAYAGQLVYSDEVDAEIAAQALVMHVRSCTSDVLRIPFYVGDDRSRTWVITRTDGGLRLKHDHRHEDGEEDIITQYGGDSASVTPNRTEFPVDQFSIDLFTREGLDQSTTNVWAVEIDQTKFAYELSRENRFFRVEFDLSETVETPPAPWGAEDQ